MGNTSGPQWRVEHDHVDGVTVVVLVGEHDIFTAEPVQRHLWFAWRAGPTVVDLERCSFLDSTMLQVLIDAGRDARSLGHGFVLTAPTQPGVARLMEVAGLDLPTAGSLADAVAMAREMSAV